MLNLIDGGIQHSNLFLHMPVFDEIYYEGILEGKVRKYRVIHEQQPCRLLCLNVIRKDEDIIWQGLHDMVKRGVTDAAPSLRGVYTFDLLTIDIHNEINTFRFHELTTSVIKTSQRLNPGDTRLVKYSSSYGLMQKLAHEDWGKIVFKSSVEVIKDKPHFLDIPIKHLLANFEYSHEPGILLLNDLSQNALFDSDDVKQQERLNKTMQSQAASTIEFPVEVYIQDKNGVRELYSGTTVK